MRGKERSKHITNAGGSKTRSPSHHQSSDKHKGGDQLTPHIHHQQAGKDCTPFCVWRNRVYTPSLGDSTLNVLPTFTHWKILHHLMQGISLLTPPCMQAPAHFCFLMFYKKLMPPPKKKSCTIVVILQIKCWRKGKEKGNVPLIWWQLVVQALPLQKTHQRWLEMTAVESMVSH